MKYKLIAMDVDGTLVGKDCAVSEQNKRAIAEAADKGVHVALCSGRAYASLSIFAKRAGLPSGSYIIGLNGGSVHQYPSGEALREIKLDGSVARRITRIVERYNGYAVVYTDSWHILIKDRNEYTDDYAAASMTEARYVDDYAEAIGADVAKILFLGETAELRRIEADNGDDAEFDVILSSDRLLEFMPPGVSKGGGLRFLCERLGIDIAETIAIGDQENDVSMIEAAGLGCVMANGLDTVKARGQYVTERGCLDGGVAEVIERFILSERN